MTALAVALGALVGAPARFLVDDWVTRRTRSALPWGTFVVNVAGSLILGLLVGLITEGHGGEQAFALAGTGFCGALTTWSTVSWETVRLAAEGTPVRAVVTMLGSLAAGLGVAWAGLELGLRLG